jgi:geranylgeranyl pyrophosphate synthase
MTRGEEILRQRAREFEESFKRMLAPEPSAPRKLTDAIHYAVLAGGKRLRPALVMEACAAVRADGGVNPDAKICALAIELVHTFSLVHDDLPAMDDDDLRRGKPTVHRAFTEAHAILAGDAMLTQAFELIGRHCSSDLVPALVTDLAEHTGLHGMIGGQVWDIENENVELKLDWVRSIHLKKTASLMCCACKLGARCGRATTEQFNQLASFAMHLGLAFQIIDDILDVTSTPQELGKQTGKDATRGKNTYPARLGLEGARAAAEDEVRQALAALNVLEHRAAPLAAITDFIAERVK